MKNKKNLKKVTLYIQMDSPKRKKARTKKRKTSKKQEQPKHFLDKFR